MGVYYYTKEDYENLRKNEKTEEYKLAADVNGNIIVSDELKRKLGIKDGSEL